MNLDHVFSCLFYILSQYYEGLNNWLDGHLEIHYFYTGCVYIVNWTLSSEPLAKTVTTASAVLLVFCLYVVLALSLLSQEPWRSDPA